MRRLNLHLLALVCGIASAVSPAAVQAREVTREVESFPIRLVSPAAGATLTAGSTVTLEWAPLGELEEAEEWEAFLSLDDGKTYPLRITPHLDLDLHRVEWRVPAVATPAARLLLRFGDEREEETAVRLPQRFAIVAPAVTPPADDLALARVAPAQGEPALPGHRGVVAWMEGSRRGGSLHQVVAAEQPGIQGRLAPPESLPEPALLASGQSPLPLPRLVRGSPGPLPSYRTAPARPGKGPLVSSDILILIQRQNE